MLRGRRCASTIAGDRESRIEKRRRLFLSPALRERGHCRFARNGGLAGGTAVMAITKRSIETHKFGALLNGQIESPDRHGQDRPSIGSRA
jgi:hypothetical protein